MAPNNYSREIGALTEAVINLKNVANSLSQGQQDIRADVAVLQQMLSSAQGSWKAISIISAVVGGLVSVGLIKIAPFIGVIPK